MKRQKKVSLIYQNDFRNTYHVLNDIRDYLQEINLCELFFYNANYETDKREIPEFVIIAKIN